MKPKKRPRCPTCGALRRVEARSYADRAEYQRVAARARRRGMSVAEYRAAVEAESKPEPSCAACGCLESERCPCFGREV